MLEFFTSEQAAMATVRQQLEKEMPLIKQRILHAISQGETCAYYSGTISLATQKLLEYGHFNIRRRSAYGDFVISWEDPYNQICVRLSQNEEIIKKLEDFKSLQ